MEAIMETVYSIRLSQEELDELLAILGEASDKYVENADEWFGKLCMALPHNNRGI